MTDAGLLSLVQWLSPAFPVGGFAYSHGLEAAVVAGEVTTADALRLWLGDVIAFGSGRTDAILLAASLRPGADFAALAALAGGLASGRERLEETAAQGAAFTMTTNALTGQDHPAAPLPVAVGRAAAGLGLAPEQVIAVYLHSFATNLVQAGVRFIPLGQTEGQAALAALHPLIGAVAAEAVQAGIDDIGSACFGADMASLRHEDLEVRIFKS
jgi:urease accessory protein